jgi:hypothetical protein
MGSFTALSSILPLRNIEIGAGDAAPVRAYKGILLAIKELQRQGSDQDPEYASVPSKVPTPFSINYGGSEGYKFDILVDIDNGITGDYAVTPVGSAVDLGIESAETPALSSRRDIDLSIVFNNSFKYSIDSALAAMAFVEGLEEEVAKEGSGTYADGTYTDQVVGTSGKRTPFSSTYEWTISKTNNAYVLTPTANS